MPAHTTITPAFDVRRSLRTALALWLIITLYVTHIVLPPGFMPEATAASWLKIRICTAAGPQSILIDAQDGTEHKPTPSKRPDHQQKLCSFAKLLTPLLALPDAASEPAFFPSLANLFLQDNSTALPDYLAAAYLARAPPA